MTDATSLTMPLRSDSVVRAVVERISEALIKGELKGGDYLPSELELARNLEVGKSTVREAVKMLQAVGVVEVRRGQGTIIRQEPGEDLLSPVIFQLILQSSRVHDLVDLRVMFEPAYTIMAMERATPGDIGKIRRTIERFERAVGEGVTSAEDDLAFHQAVLESTHNPFVVTIGRTILRLFDVSISKALETVSATALEYHKRIFDAFCAKDEARLRREIMASFEGWKRGLSEASSEECT